MDVSGNSNGVFRGTFLFFVDGKCMYDYRTLLDIPDEPGWMLRQEVVERWTFLVDDDYDNAVWTAGDGNAERLELESLELESLAWSHSYSP